MGDVKLCVVGARGRMGLRVIDLAQQTEGISVQGALEAEACPGAGEDVLPGVALGHDPSLALDGCQVYIDFSTPEGTRDAATHAGRMAKS